MSNPLFGMLSGQMQTNPMMQKFQQFRQMFRGNPQEQIRQLLSSRQVNQQQYNQAVQMAQQFQQMLGGK